MQLSQLDLISGALPSQGLVTDAGTTGVTTIQAGYCTTSGAITLNLGPRAQFCMIPSALSLLADGDTQTVAEDTQHFVGWGPRRGPIREVGLPFPMLSASLYVDGSMKELTLETGKENNPSLRGDGSPG